MSGGLFLLSALTVGLIVLTVMACRHLDQMERDDANRRAALLRELRRYDHAE